jgi:phage-related protein
MLTPIVNGLAQEFMSFVKNNMPEIKEALTKLATFVTNFAKDLFSDEGRNKIINDIKYYFGLMMIEIKKATLGKLGLYSNKDATEDEARLKTEKEVYDKVAELKREEMSNAGKKQALADLAAGKDKEAYDKEIKASSEKIAALQRTQQDAGKDQAAITAIQTEIDKEKVKQEKQIKKVQTYP